MTVIRKIILTLLTSFVTLYSWAQVSFSLQVSARQIGLDDILQVEYAIKNADQTSPLTQINFNGWNVLSGPQTSQQMTSINGNVEQSISYIFLLKPLHKGKLTVPGTSIIANGKRYSCNSIIVDVTNQSSSQPHHNPNASNGGGLSGSLQSMLDQMNAEDEPSEVSGNVLRPGEDPAKKIKDYMFIKVTPSKSTCYIGEPILVTYELFTALASTSKISKQPTFNGAGIVDLTQSPTPKNVTVNGQQYKSYILRKVQLTPLQTGSIDLGQAEVSSTVPFASINNPYQPHDYSAQITNKPTFVTVKDLPTVGRPANFTGAIGNFTITAKPDQVSCPAGENNNLNLIVEGVGNLQNTTLPSINWPKELDHYDGTDSQQVDRNAYPPSVLKQFEIPIIGQHEGSVTIPAITFSYFDPEKGEYKTINSAPVSILFTKALPKGKLDSGNGFDQSLSIRNLMWIPIAIIFLIIIILIAVSKKKKKKTAATASSTVVPSIISEPQKAVAKNDQQIQISPIEEKAISTSNEDFSRFMPAGVQPLPTESSLHEKAKTDYHAALADLELESDNVQFFHLTKALLIQFLQESTHSTSTSATELLDQFSTSDTVATNDIKNIFTKIDEAFYSPTFAMQNIRQDVLDKLKVILH